MVQIALLSRFYISSSAPWSERIPPGVDSYDQSIDSAKNTTHRDFDETRKVVCFRYSIPLSYSNGQKQISDVKYVLERFLRNAAIGFHSSNGHEKDDIENPGEALVLDTKYFRLCKIKDRYYAVAQMPLRDCRLM